MDETYRIINTVIDDLRRCAPTITTLKIELELRKIKHVLLVIESQSKPPTSVRDLLVRLKSTYDSSEDYERFLQFVTKVAEELKQITHRPGTQRDRRNGMAGTMMRRKNDPL